MIYKSFPPCQALSGSVRNYTIIHFEFDRHKTVPAKQRSPKPEQKLVFYIKGSVNLLSSKTGTTKTPPAAAIFTHQLERKIFQVSPEFLALVVYLRPGALHQLIRLPMHEFREDYCSAETFFGSAIHDVNEQLTGARDFTSMIASIEKFLLSRFKPVVTENAIDSVASQVLKDPTIFSLDAMAQHACLSTKQFYRKFTQRVGVSPKFFSRLSRFNHAYQYKLNNPATSWSSIAQEFSYTDYHHLEKEFKEFSGLTPKEWIATELSAPERLLKLR